jgi:hypothetical protein
MVPLKTEKEREREREREAFKERMRKKSKIKYFHNFRSLKIYCQLSCIMDGHR